MTLAVVGVRRRMLRSNRITSSPVNLHPRTHLRYSLRAKLIRVPPKHPVTFRRASTEERRLSRRENRVVIIIWGGGRVEIGDWLKKKRNGNGMQERMRINITRDAYENKGVSCEFLFFSRASLIYVEQNSGDERERKR